MVKITIICVGKIKEKYLKEAISEYSKRLSKFCCLEIKEVADEKTGQNMSPAEEALIKDKEGERIAAVVKPDDYLVTLEIEGEMTTSRGFSEKLSGLLVKGVSKVTFVIGGSVGLSDNIIQRSNYHLSFSKMTFPHQLMRVILLEQIYRSFKIAAGEPYHK